jgi:hypothetical protein
MSAAAHWFWGLTTLACLVWYSTITFLVAYRGVIDIRGMLGRLRQGQLDDEAARANPPKPGV